MDTPTISVSVAAASAALLWTIFDAPTLYEDDLQSRSAMTFVWFLSDDLINFVQDPAIASPSVAGAVAATSMDSSKLGVFEPLTEWLRMGVVRATGATGFGMLPQMRLVSRALHICNVLLAALLLPAFLQSRPRGTSVLPHICGFAAASVVGSMAERVEVVSWPSANGYLLGTCLALLMCHVHVALGGATWALYPRVYRWLLCGLLTAAAALSKAACITVFVAPALLDAGTWLLFAHGAPATTRAYPKRPRDAERPAEHTGLLALVGRLILEQSLALSSGAAVASLATKASALDQRRALQPEQQLSASQRGLRALAMLGQHYRRVVRPSEGGLAVRYYAPHAALSADNSDLLSSASIGACILGLALFTLLGALTQRLCGQPVRGLLAAGAVAALMALGHALVMLPTLGLLSDHIQTVGADRYSYCADFLMLAPATALGLHALCSADAGVKEKSHPSTGVGVKEKITTSRSFGWGVQARRALAALAVGALLYANATASRAQLQRWRTNEALADDMIEQSRGLDPVPMVHRAIAVVESDPSKAIELLLRVQSHTPHPKVWLNLAHAYKQRAVHACAPPPSGSAEPTALARCAADFGAAQAQLLKVVASNPDEMGLGKQSADLVSARLEFQMRLGQLHSPKATEAGAPVNVNGLRELLEFGAQLWAASAKGSQTAEVRGALAPTLAGAYVNYASILEQLRQPLGEVEAALVAALEIHPGYDLAHLNLAIALANDGQLKNGLVSAKEAVARAATDDIRSRATALVAMIQKEM